MESHDPKAIALLKRVGNQCEHTSVNFAKGSYVIEGKLTLFSFYPPLESF